MSGGRASRQKGDRFERSCVKALQDAGVGGERVPLSGSAGGKFSGDISVPVRGVDKVLECKKRSNGSGFKMLYDWLAGNYGICIAMDRSDALVVLRLTDFAELAALPPAALTDVLQPSRLPFRVLSKDEVEAA